MNQITFIFKNMHHDGHGLMGYQL